jgi:uncharacterized protein YndB with AHSA1/START domain
MAARTLPLVCTAKSHHRSGSRLHGSGRTRRVAWGDTLVSVDFIDAGDGTTDLVITHTRFADADRAGNHERGWTQLLRLIEHYVTKEEQ